MKFSLSKRATARFVNVKDFAENQVNTDYGRDMIMSNIRCLIDGRDYAQIAQFVAVVEEMFSDKTIATLVRYIFKYNMVPIQFLWRDSIKEEEDFLDFVKAAGNISVLDEWLDLCTKPFYKS